VLARRHPQVLADRAPDAVEQRVARQHTSGMATGQACMASRARVTACERSALRRPAAGPGTCKASIKALASASSARKHPSVDMNTRPMILEIWGPESVHRAASRGSLRMEITRPV